MTTENTNTQNNVIVLAVAGNSVAALTHDLFKDIDFSGISTAIENIGAHNQNMTIEEKEMATSIVTQWQKDVIVRLREKGTEFSNFVSFIEHTSTHGRISGQDLFDEIGEELADKTNTVTQYDKLIAALDELEKHYQTRPIEPIEREDRTYKEKLEEEKKYSLEKAQYNLKETKLVREVYLAEFEWKKLVKQNKEVKELLKKSKRFNKDIGKFTQMCEDKAQLAKLNIAVSNKGVRDSLRELLNFNATI